MADMVYDPPHYDRGGLEAIDVIEGIIDGLPAVEAACLANVLKYALRAGKKGDAAQDIAKANNYAHRLCTGRWRGGRGMGGDDGLR